MMSDDYDVVIVGSGAGGAAAAWELTRNGVHVLVLEAGPHFDPIKDSRLHYPDWELSGFPEDLARGATRYTFGAMQPLEARWDGLRSWNRVQGRLNRGNHRSGWKYHHVRGVGGSTLHFSGEAHRLHPAAMKMYSRFGVAVDWPLDYSDLEPYYEAAERLIGVAGPARSLRPRRTAFQLPAHPPSYASRRLMAIGPALGLQWEANSLAILSRPYDGRPRCNYCANCHRGCPRADKGSADVTFMGHAMATGKCTLLAEASVFRIEAGSAGRIHSVAYMHQGQPHAVRTRVLVMACGAIETPRLLLLSDNSHAPQGIANERGQVGRHFMETLSWTSSALQAEDLGSFRGTPSDVITWTHNAPDAIPGVIGGCRFGAGTVEAGYLGPIAYAQRAVAGWGLAHKRAMRQSFGHMLAVGAIGESLPNASSCVDLDPQSKDKYGNRLARINTWLADAELLRLAFMADTCRRILRAAGNGEMVDEYGTYDFFSSTHVFGTCRMGTDPERSVVDAIGRAHAWRNLFIADASVFPSSGGGESPSLTVEALAIRTTDHIQTALGRGEL